jgi:hypothetical protein
MEIRWLLVIGTMLLSGIGFNNCARVIPGLSTESGLIIGESGISESGGFKCEETIRDTFATTYHPFLVGTCNGTCHQHSSTWGSEDVRTSLISFISKGVELIDYQATNPHSTNNFGRVQEEQISQFKGDFNVAYNSYLTCVESGGGSTNDSIMLSAKTFVPSGTNFIQMQWNVSSETFKASDQNRLNAVFKIMVRKEILGSQTVLNIKDPSITLGSGVTTTKLGGLRIHINGLRNSGYTTHSMLDRVLSGTTEIPLAPGAAVGTTTFDSFDPTVSGSTGFGFVLEDLEFDYNPGGVLIRYADLMGTDVSKNVLARRCTPCHSPGGSGIAKLNISSYSDVFNKAGTMMTAVNAGTMPSTGGPLSASDKTVLENWINSGKQQ